MILDLWVYHDNVHLLIPYNMTYNTWQYLHMTKSTWVVTRSKSSRYLNYKWNIIQTMIIIRASIRYNDYSGFLWRNIIVSHLDHHLDHKTLISKYLMTLGFYFDSILKICYLNSSLRDSELLYITIRLNIRK